MVNALLLLGLVQTQEFRLSAYDIGGEKIRPAVPTWTIPGPAGTIRGDRVVRQRFAQELGRTWSELAEKLKSLSEPPARKWKLTVVVESDHESDFVLMGGTRLQERMAIGGPDEKGLKNEIALLAEMAKAYTGGLLALDVVYKADPGLDWITPNRDRFAQNAILPEVGDVGSLIIVNARSTGSVVTRRIGAIPVSEVPFFGVYDSARPGLAARYLFNAWVRQLELAQAKAGLPLTVQSVETAAFMDPTWEVPRLLNPLSQIDAGLLDAYTSGQLVQAVPAQEAPAPGQIESVPVPSVARKLAFDSGFAEGLPVSWYWVGKTVADDERGAVGQFEESYGYRGGGVRLLGDDSGAAFAQVEKEPILSFQVKASVGTSPLDVVAMGEEGPYRFRLFGALPEPKDSLGCGEVKTLDVPADGAWHEVTIDLRASGVQNLAAVYLATPPISRVLRQFTSGKVSLDDLELRTARTGETPTAELATEAAKPDARSSSFLARIAFADSLTTAVSESDRAELRALLSDAQTDVLVAALQAVGRLSVKDADAQVAELGKSFVPRISQAACAALTALGTETSLAFLRSAPGTGPFDATRAFGSRAIVRLDPKTKPADLIQTLVSREWRVRLAGAESIARLPGETAQLVAMSFINDAEPRSRAGVVRALDFSFDAVKTRLVEVSRSDPDSWVRAVALARLLHEESKHRQAALGRLAEAPVWDKIFVAEVLRDDGLAILKTLLSDSNWKVRAAAVANVPRMKGATTNDVNYGEGDPRVRAIIDGLVWP